MLKLMLNFEKGDFFNAEGDLREDLGISYKKVKEYTLYPKLDFLPTNEDGTPNTDDQTYGFYSIDGEKYTATEIHGKVLNKYLAVL